MRLVTPVNRDTLRSKFIVVDQLNQKRLLTILQENIAQEAVLHTNEAGSYKAMGKEFGGYDSVQHNAGERVRGNVTTNTVEGLYSNSKRGMEVVFKHFGKLHLRR